MIPGPLRPATRSAHPTTLMPRDAATAGAASVPVAAAAELTLGCGVRRAAWLPHPTVRLVARGYGVTEPMKVPQFTKWSRGRFGMYSPANQMVPVGVPTAAE